MVNHCADLNDTCASMVRSAAHNAAPTNVPYKRAGIKKADSIEPTLLASWLMYLIATKPFTAYQMQVAISAERHQRHVHGRGLARLQ